MSSTSPKRDPLPPFCREVLQLYTEALGDVRFPDLDLGSLQASAEQARAAQLAVERVEAKLEIARAQLQEQLDAMTSSAERALAYAQVFARTDPKLQARVDQVGGVPANAASAEPRAKRRARRSKVEQDANLFAPQALPARETVTETEGAA
jgi:hypothetical protein